MTTDEDIKALADRLLHNSDTAAVLEAADALEAQAAQVAEQTVQLRVVRLDRDGAVKRMEAAEKRLAEVEASRDGYVKQRNALQAECDRQKRRADRLESALREQRLKPGVRAVIRHLHERADKMNHYPAKQWLNSLAFELGWKLSAGRIDIQDAIDTTINAALSGSSDPRKDVAR